MEASALTSATHSGLLVRRSPLWRLQGDERLVALIREGHDLAFEVLFDRYQSLIEELPFGDPLRLPLETAVYGGMNELSFDTAGRITLPEALCDMFGLTDWVAMVGLGDRFQIWERDAFRAHRAEMLKVARSGLADLRRAQRPVPAKGAAE